MCFLFLFMLNYLVVQKKENKMNKLIRQIIVVIIGQVIIGIGIGFLLYANLGVDSSSVFQTGLAKLLAIRYGQAVTICNGSILLIIFLVDRHYISVASVTALFAVGFGADTSYALLLKLLPYDFNIAIRILISLLASGIMAIGVSIYINGGLGVGSVDIVSEFLTDKTHFEYRKVRIFVDFSFLIVGYLIGGTFGIGTVIGAIVTGPFVQALRPIFYKKIRNFISYQH